MRGHRRGRIRVACVFGPAPASHATNLNNFPTTHKTQGAHHHHHGHHHGDGKGKPPPLPGLAHRKKALKKQAKKEEEDGDASSDSSYSSYSDSDFSDSDSGGEEEEGAGEGNGAGGDDEVKGEEAEAEPEPVLSIQMIVDGRASMRPTANCPFPRINWKGTRVRRVASRVCVCRFFWGGGWVGGNNVRSDG